MTSPSIPGRIRPHAVPGVIFTVVVATIIFVPPLVLGEITPRTYAITAAVLILAVGSALPYALLVGIGTLPFLYAGLASYARPQPTGTTPHTFSASEVLRHVVAGVAYVLAAAAVGAIGLGAQIGTTNVTETVPNFVQPVFLILGGVIIAVAFTVLQLWRYGTPFRKLDRGTVIGTGTLGLLLAVSPTVTFWLFNNIS